MNMTNGNDSAFGYGYSTADGRSHQESEGLTKREYFAAMAMQGILMGDNGYAIRAALTPENVAEGAIDYADALITSLNKT